MALLSHYDAGFEEINVIVITSLGYIENLSSLYREQKDISQNVLFYMILLEANVSLQI